MNQSLGEKWILMSMSRTKPPINGTVAAFILLGIGVIYAVYEVIFYSSFPFSVVGFYWFLAYIVFCGTAIWHIIDKKDRQIDDLKRDLAAYQGSLQAMRLDEKANESKKHA